jgi:hypothetical protein
MKFSAITNDCLVMFGVQMEGYAVA